MVISVGCFSQIKYIYIEDLCSGQVSLQGSGGLGSALGVGVCLVSLPCCPVNHTLVERVLRGNRMQKGLRKQWEPWIWELGSSGWLGAVGSWESLRGLSWRVQGPQTGVREPRGHGRNNSFAGQV